MKLIKILACLPLLCIAMASCSDEKDGPNLSAVKPAPDFTDTRDGKTYKCVQIGDQIWMAENLAYFPAGGTFDGCFTWNQSKPGPSSLTYPKDVFISLWNATADDPTHNWSQESRYSAEQYKAFISHYANDEYSQSTFQSMISDIFYRAFRDAFYERLTKYVEENQDVFRDQFITLLAEAENLNGHYSETYGYLYSHDCAMNVVPEGWRIPSDEDWKKLERNLGMSENDCNTLEGWRGSGIGNVLKAGGGSGFDALMAGGNHYSGDGSNLYIKKLEAAYFWSSESKTLNIRDPNAKDDEDSEDSEGSDGSDGKDDGDKFITVREGIMRQLALYDSGIWRGTVRLEANKRATTLSVRCVKDAK